MIEQDPDALIHTVKFIQSSGRVLRAQEDGPPGTVLRLRETTQATTIRACRIKRAEQGAQLPEVRVNGRERRGSTDVAQIRRRVRAIEHGQVTGHLGQVRTYVEHVTL